MFQATTLCLLFFMPSPFVDDDFDPYLLKAVHDTQHTMMREYQERVHTGVSGWLDNAPLRIKGKDDHRNPFKNTYTQRVSPKYGTQPSVEQAIYEVTTRQRALNAALVLSRALRTRLLMLIDFAEQRDKTAFAREHVDILTAKIRLHRSVLVSHYENGVGFLRLEGRPNWRESYF